MWQEVRNNAEIADLMEQFGGFHDSCITGIVYESGAYVDKKNCMRMGEALPYSVTLRLQSQWCKPIELLFLGVRKCSIVGYPCGWFCNLYGAHLAFHTDLCGNMTGITGVERLLVWADDSDFRPADYRETTLPDQNSYTYIIAERLFWQFTEETPPAAKPEEE